MAQATILASGITAATSTDVTITSGTVKSVGIFVAAGAIPGALSLAVMMDTPGADVVVGKLTAAAPIIVLSGPGTYRVVRPVVPSAVGVFTEG